MSGGLPSNLGDPIDLSAGPRLGGGILFGPSSPTGGVEVPPVAGAHAFEHTQSEPADVWIVEHNLGRLPAAWSLFDDQGRLRDEYLVEFPTVNRALVRMDVPTAGTIRMI